MALADPAWLPQAAWVLEPLAEGIPETDITAGRVSFRAPRGARAFPAAVRLLDGAGIAIEDATARRPSLDDVFISVLGRAAGTARRGGHEHSRDHRPARPAAGPASGFARHAPPSANVKGNPHEGLWSHLTASLRAFSREWSKARRHMLDDKQRNMSHWQRHKGHRS